MNSLHWGRAASSLTAVALLLSCGKEPEPRFALEPGPGNRLYRFDRQSGEVVEVIDGELLRLEYRSPEPQFPGVSMATRRPREWPGLNGPVEWGKSQIRFRTFWRDGYLHYLGAVEATEELTAAMAEGEPSLMLILSDEFGFNLHTVTVEMASLVRTVDDEGSPVEFSFQGKTPMAVEAFSLVGNVHAQWRAR